METRHSNDSLSLILQTANDFFTAKNMNEAIEKYRHAIEILDKLPTKTWDEYYLLYKCYKRIGEAFYHTKKFDQAFNAFQQYENVLLTSSTLLKEKNQNNNNNNNNDHNEVMDDDDFDSILYQITKKQKELGYFFEEMNIRYKAEIVYLTAIDNLFSLRSKMTRSKTTTAFLLLHQLYQRLSCIHPEHSYQHQLYNIFSKLLDKQLANHYVYLDSLLIELKDQPTSVRNNFVKAMTFILDNLDADTFPNLSFKNFLKDNQIHYEFLRALIKKEQEKQLKLTTILGDHTSTITALVQEVLTLKGMVKDLQEEIQILRKSPFNLPEDNNPLVNSHAQSTPSLIYDKSHKEGLKRLTTLNFNQKNSKENEIDHVEFENKIVRKS